MEARHGVRILSSYLAAAALALAFTPTLASGADDVRKTTYKELVANPSAARRNENLRAYLLGLGDAIWMDYVCDEADRKTVTNSDAIIDSLIDFSRSAWGKLYLEGTSGVGGINYDMSAGNALLKMFTEHSRCRPYDRRKQQFER